MQRSGMKLKSQDHDFSTLEDRLKEIGSRAHKIGQGEPLPKDYQTEASSGQIVVVPLLASKSSQEAA